MMNRLQKKCIFASTALHSLLVGLLLFGSALMPAPHETPFIPIKVYRSEDVSAALNSGASLDAQAAPSPPLAPVNPKPEPAPPPVKPLPEPPKPKPVEPVSKPIEEPPKVEHRSFLKDLFAPAKPDKVTKPIKDEDAETPKPPHKIEIDKNSLKPVVRNKSEKTDQAQAAADAKAKADRKRAAQQFASAYKNISKNISSSTPVEMPSGVGTPGPVSVNYGSIISSKYDAAWRPPTDVDESLATAEATVTIARDGSVISSHIAKSSGNVSLDRSIENALGAVTFIEPFPSSFKQQQITVTIPFNLRTKRQTG